MGSERGNISKFMYFQRNISEDTFVWKKLFVFYMVFYQVSSQSFTVVPSNGLKTVEGCNVNLLWNYDSGGRNLIDITWFISAAKVQILRVTPGGPDVPTPGYEVQSISNTTHNAGLKILNVGPSDVDVYSIIAFFDNGPLSDNNRQFSLLPGGNKFKGYLANQLQGTFSAAESCAETGDMMQSVNNLWNVNNFAGTVGTGVLLKIQVETAADIKIDGHGCTNTMECELEINAVSAGTKEVAIEITYSGVYILSGKLKIQFDEEKADTAAYYATVIIQPICLILHIIICVVAVKKDNKTLLIAGNAVLGSISFITMLATAISTCPGDDMYCGLHAGLGVVVTGIIIIVTITVCCVRFKISKGPVP